MNKEGIFKYNVDVRPVAMILTTIGLSLLPFLVPMPLWLLVPHFALVIFARSFLPFVQHNHAHLAVFNSTLLNNIYNVCLAQCTGYSTAMWELHHNRGHHRNFLTPKLDVARIIDLKTGLVMGRWRYAFQGNLTILPDAIKIGLEEGRQGRKSLLPKLFGEIALQATITAALLLWHPLLALAFFIVPNAFNAFMIWWESYPHHLGVPVTSLYDASITIESSSYNAQTLNLGHHTAHHEKPTLHWSLLPARTEAIRSLIPAMCLHEEYDRSAKVQLRTTRSKSQYPSFAAEKATLI